MVPAAWALDQVYDQRQVLLGFGGAQPARVFWCAPEERKKLVKSQLFGHTPIVLQPGTHHIP